MANDLTIGIVEMRNGKPMASSLVVAEKFGKRHDNVLRAIETLEVPDEFRLLNFEEATYLDDQGKPRPMVWMTWKAFAFLATGFTGREAAQWKIRFIDKFETMANQLSSPNVLPLRPDPQALAHTFNGWLEHAREEGRKEVGQELEALCNRLDEERRNTSAAMSVVVDRMHNLAGHIRTVANEWDAGKFGGTLPPDWLSVPYSGHLGIEQVLLGLGFKLQSQATEFLEKLKWVDHRPRLLRREPGSFQAEFEYEPHYDIPILSKQGFCESTADTILNVLPKGRAFLEVRLNYLWHTYDLRGIHEIMAIRGIICGGKHAGDLPDLLEAFRTNSAPKSQRFTAPLPKKLNDEGQK